MEENGISGVSGGLCLAIGTGKGLLSPSPPLRQVRALQALEGELGRKEAPALGKRQTNPWPIKGQSGFAESCWLPLPE